MRYLCQIYSMYSVIINVSITLHFRYPVSMNKTLLNESLTKWLHLKRRHSAYRGSVKPNRICRLSET